MSNLKKAISPAALISIGAAGVIGSSWLYLGSSFFAEFGAGGTILGFAVATILASFVAMSYSWFASQFPRAGGEVVYVFVAGNRLLGYTVGWLLIGTFTALAAFYFTATARLLSTVWPQLNSFPMYSIGGSDVYLPAIIIGLALSLFIFFVNWLGAAISAKTELLLFAAMVVLAGFVVVAGFSSGSVENFWPLFDAELTGRGNVSNILSFVLPAMAFMTGFSVVAIMAEEATSSPRRIGQIIVWSVVIAGLFYIIVLTATAWVLPWQDIAKMTNGTIEAFDVAGMPIISTAAFVIGVLGLFTTFIAVFSASARIMVALARIELFPKVFATVDKKSGAPRAALTFTLIIGIALGLLGPGALVWFLNTMGVYIGIVWAISIWSYYRMPIINKTLKDGSSTPKRSIFPAIGGIAAIAIVLAALLPFSPTALTSPYEYLIVLGWFGLGLLIYLFSPKKMTRKESLKALLGEFYDEEHIK
ncbi:APC family permease [Alcaligenaceae bacterium]|nr:APC family permease [Alcaligenaceae bacterium]